MGRINLHHYNLVAADSEMLQSATHQVAMLFDAYPFWCRIKRLGGPGSWNPNSIVANIENEVGRKFVMSDQASKQFLVDQPVARGFVIADRVGSFFFHTNPNRRFADVIKSAILISSISSHS